MSKKEKLLSKIKNNPTNVKFEILQTLLEDAGYEAKSSGGSHVVFRKTAAEPITIPKKRPVKKWYVLEVLKILEGEGNEKR